MKEFQTKHLRFILASKQTARLVPGQSKLRPCTVLRIRSCDPDVDCTNFTNFLCIATFQFSRIEGSRNKRGSKEHAKSVFEMAKFWLGRLKAENIFLPDVMAIVKHAHSGRSFVGASIAVSDFLRPICLFNRILNLKDGLGASVIFSESLNIPDKSNWQFSYAYKAERYDSLNDGLPCQNCRMIFQEDKSGRGGPTFLGACAEYCAVDELLPNEQTLRYTMDECVKSKLERKLEQCTDLFKEYRDKSKKCITAFESGNLNEIETLYWDVIYLFHTFGLRPECNRHF